MARIPWNGLVASTSWRRENPLFPAHLAEVNTAVSSIYKCGIMLVLKGMVFLRDHLYCCSSWMN